MTSHAELGASSSDRWMNCLGSVRMSRGLPNTTSEYAIEGTAAHELALMCRKTGKAAVDFYETVIEVDDREGGTIGIVVDAEMVDAVQVFLDTVDAMVATDKLAVVVYEHSFSLESLNPPAPMFGTADAVVYSPARRHLDVPDFKYGQGVVVQAGGNPQLQYYGLGALLEFEKTFGPGLIDDITLTVVQPRAGATPVRSWTISYQDLVAFAIDLILLAHDTRKPDAPLTPGAWCKFCKAAATCTARMEAAQSVAMVTFAAMPIDLPPAVETLPVAVLGDVINKAHIIEEWLRSVRDHAFMLLNRGEDVPGVKLVPKRANRRWKDEAAVLAFTISKGLMADLAFDKSLKSPAQLEMVLKKYKHKLPEELYSKESTGFTLAPASDPRPAALAGPAQAFANAPLID